jgi:hypothetical protein
VVGELDDVDDARHGWVDGLLVVEQDYLGSALPCWALNSARQSPTRGVEHDPERAGRCELTFRPGGLVFPLK